MYGVQWEIKTGSFINFYFLAKGNNIKGLKVVSERDLKNNNGKNAGWLVWYGIRIYLCRPVRKKA